jgi:cytochrome c-type biogenesis protein
VILALSSGPGGWAVAFGAGMLSFLSPCVLPLVPGYLSLMSGVKATHVAAATRDETRQMVKATLLFAAGFTVVFVALGAGASAIGQALQRHQQILNQVAGVAVIAMGLFLAGFTSPRLMQQERRFQVSPSRLGAWAPPVMGVAFAFGWTPCIGPVLGPLLALAANEDTLYRGMLLLVFYSLGLAVPFVLSGLAFGRLTGAFGWVKRHYRIINLVSGLLLVAFGLLLFFNRVGEVSGRIVELFDALGLDFLSSS